MKWLSVTCALGLFLSSVHAFASFVGNWEGKGQVRDGSGATLNCQQFRFQIIQTGDQLGIRNGLVVCQPHQLKIEDLTVMNRDGSLFLDGKQIGSLTEDTVRLDYINKDRIRVRSRGQLKDGRLQYQEEWLDDRNKRVLLFQGSLNRK